VSQDKGTIWSKVTGYYHGLLAFLLLGLGWWMIGKFHLEFKTGYINAPSGSESSPEVWLPFGVCILGGFAILHGLLNLAACFCILKKIGTNFLMLNAAMNLFIFPLGTMLAIPFIKLMKATRISDPDSLVPSAERLKDKTYLDKEMSNISQTISSFKAYEKSLETPRELLLPADVSTEKRQEITRVVFMKHHPKPADVLFIFGTVQANWEQLAIEIRRGDYKRVVLAGRIGPNYFEHQIPIAQEMREKLAALGVDPEVITYQDQSDNTYEDVKFSLELIGEPNQITYAAKAHHSGRCQRSLRKFFPDCQLNPHLVNAFYGEIEVNSENWTSTEIGRGRVYGEYQRIQKYADKGDISLYP